MQKLLALSLQGTPIAAPGNVPTGGLSPNGWNIIYTGISIFLLIIVALALIFLIWAGIRLTMSEGDKAKVDASRKQAIYSIVGLVIALLAFAIINIVGNLFGVQLF